MNEVEDYITQIEDLQVEIEDLNKKLKEAESLADTNPDLARAICAFAEWQRTGYTRGENNALHAVTIQLWDEVAENVWKILGYYPEDISHRLQRLESTGKN